MHRRRVIYSKLCMKENSSKKKQVVVALSGIPSPGDGSYQGIPAQVQVFKESHDPSARSRKTFHNPKLSITLESARVSVLGLSQQNSSGRKLSRGAGPSCSFSVTTGEGTCYEFTAENESERLVWVTVMEFLAMFPYSSIPEVPKFNPVFRRDTDPAHYNADSLWPVYILPEEVGSRCSIIGAHLLTLQGRVAGSHPRPGKLEIYSPADSTDPMVTWDHDKIRRTGKLGQLLFIEIGRRCKGGPGLMWMYTGNCDKKAHELRDVLRRFLFEEVRTGDQEASTCTQVPLASVSSPAPRCSVQQTASPPLPPLRRSNSIATASPSRSAPKLPHNYHVLEPAVLPPTCTH